MSNKRPLVCVTRKLPERVETRMHELFDIRLATNTTPMGRDELGELMAKAEVLVPTLGDHIDADLIAKAGDQLKLIANFGNGTDHIDIKAAYDRKI